MTGDGIEGEGKAEANDRSDRDDGGFLHEAARLDELVCGPMIRALTVLLLWGGGVSAQVLPALYDVIGVASDDVLNVRAAPQP